MPTDPAPFRGSLQVRFWSPSLDPEQALDSLANFLGDYGPTGNDFEIKPGGGNWRPAKPDASLAGLGDWAQDHGLTVIRRERVGQKSGRAGWQGLYILTLAPQVKH